MIKTRLVRIFEIISVQVKERYFFFQTTFVIAIFFIFLGFLIGNLFGTFLQIIRHFLQWDGFIVAGILIFIEVINYTIYHRKGRSFLILWKFRSTKVFRRKYQVAGINSIDKSVQRTAKFRMEKRNFFNSFIFLRSLNYFKIGIMLGFFIDAFKVGS